MKILVINGPNLNMLGTREPQIYGTLSLDEISDELKDFARELDGSIKIEFFFFFYEGGIVDKIQGAKDEFDGIIINPAAYTHTSVAIADAIASVGIKTVEVHLSNIYSREEFRHHSFVAPNCLGQVAGFSKNGYKMALLGLYLAQK